MKSVDAFVGFSMNGEMELAVEKTKGPKKVLSGFEVRLSGSSGNVTMALKVLGATPHLLGLVGVGKETSWEDKLLLEAVRQSQVQLSYLKALEHTNVAAVPVIGGKNGQVWGKRNGVVSSAVKSSLKKVEGLALDRSFAVITGLMADEVPFADALLRKARNGFRVLNAKDIFCGTAEFAGLLSKVDLLVLNQREFEATGKSLEKLHACGPRIIVVTQDIRGGFFSFQSANPVSFPAMHFKGGNFETGAGDWFLGALVAEFIKLKESAESIMLGEFSNVIAFAAMIAGRKVTMPGSSNGPARDEVWV